VREKLARGRFDVTLRLGGILTIGAALDRERAKAALEELRSLRDEIAPGQEVPFWMIAHVPDVFVSPLAREESAVRAAVTSAFERAAQALDEMRCAEGKSLAKDLEARLDRLAELVEKVEDKSSGLADTQRRRLHDRAERIRTALDFSLDPARLEQEVVLFADRIDIAEELTRLSSHIAQFRATLSEDGIGRKLDFLLQEMTREANTVGAKTPDAAVAHLVVELKSEITRMREQVQNVE